ncbi:hypothetical protein BD410DRAFT_807234 [Rickenella mellea]|uniref:DUF1766-domain-containing protein n=1 Tax=Rickenella mellea TaxID=50990 RepID=A0A4Y7PPZ2_9AGAM|nr:hypothetical protein BD410DRAFT_807234 [Rickenella mellea]
MSKHNHFGSDEEHSTSDSEYYPSDRENFTSNGENSSTDDEHSNSDSENANSNDESSNMSGEDSGEESGDSNSDDEDSNSDNGLPNSDSENDTPDSDDELVRRVGMMSVKDSTRRSRRSSPPASVASGSNEVEELAQSLAALEFTTSRSSLRSERPSTPPPRRFLSNEKRTLSSQSAPVHRTSEKHPPYRRSLSANTTPVPNRRGFSVLAETELQSRTVAHNAMGLGVSPNTPERKNARQPHVEDFDILRQEVTIFAAEVFRAADEGAAEYAAKKYATLASSGKSVLSGKYKAAEDKIAQCVDRVYQIAANDASNCAEIKYKSVSRDHTGSGCPRPFSPLDGNSRGFGANPRRNKHKRMLDYISDKLPDITQVKLCLKMKKPLSDSEKDGYIYVIEVKNPITPQLTHLKVGRSETRMKQICHWRRHYGYGNTSLRGVEPGSRTILLEALIHIELMSYAIPIEEPTSMTRKPCTHCRKKASGDFLI